MSSKSDISLLFKLRAFKQRARNFMYEKYHGIKEYKPEHLEMPAATIKNEVSAWSGLELILADIIKRSGIEPNSCLEFGVEFGFSTAVFANYFKSVKGVDIFTGDIHAGFNDNTLLRAKKNLEAFGNIELIEADYKEFIKGNESFFDLVHVDIIHTYKDTFDCGIWAAQHSHCTLFHDTESFPEVKEAVKDIAKITGKTFFNYHQSNGLGILYKTKDGK